MATLRTFFVATVLCAIAEATVLEGQLLVRKGVEFQVNSWTIDRQSAPTTRIDASGGFVVAWASKEQDGDGYGVFARRFDAAGEALASEFLVDGFTSGSQNYARIGTAGDGRFVVVWQSVRQDGYGARVLAHLFEADGTPIAAEFEIDSQATANQRNPAVAMQEDGEFVVAWTLGYLDGIFARRFGSDGSPLSSHFQVNTYTGDDEFGVALAVDGAGDFIVTWTGKHDGSGHGVFARRFDIAGPVGSDFQVNSWTFGKQLSPEVDVDEKGAFVIVWASIQTAGHDGIFARRFDTGGMPVAAEFRVDGATAGIRLDPVVAMGHGGDFVIAWRDSLQDGDGYGLFARAFDTAGMPIGAELQLNTYTIHSQSDVVLAAGRGGDFVVAWSSDQQDHSETGIFAQRLAEPAVLDVDADGSVAALTDGLLVLRFLFGFTGAALVDQAVGTDCQRCDATTIEPYLEGLI